jgi:hypothetical protein
MPSALAIIATAALLLFAAFLFARAVWQYDDVTSGGVSEKKEKQARSATAKRMWYWARVLPCVPVSVISFFWLCLFVTIQRMKYVIGNALWCAMAGFVFNVIWVLVRVIRSVKIRRWVREPLEVKPADTDG